MQPHIDVRKALKPALKRLSDLEKKQVPFATAQALTAVAKLAQGAVRAELPSVFDRPTPFTINSIAVTPARKTNLTAVVFAKDIAAQYLLPYEDGGTQFLGAKRALLAPVQQRTNKYGNVTLGTLSRLKAKPNVFTGRIVTRTGQSISGVWQRSPAAKGKRGGLKLLIAFDDPKPVAQRLHFRDTVRTVATRNIRAEFRKALTDALSSAR